MNLIRFFCKFRYIWPNYI